MHEEAEPDIGFETRAPATLGRARRPQPTQWEQPPGASRIAIQRERESTPREDWDTIRILKAQLTGWLHPAEDFRDTMRGVPSAQIGMNFWLGADDQLYCYNDEDELHAHFGPVAWWPRHFTLRATLRGAPSSEERSAVIDALQERIDELSLR